MKKLARVVIVGRSNVGKSTLFNRLSVGVKSLTFDYEGVTRDFLKDTISWQGYPFELIDTGGLSLQPFKDPLMEEGRKRALSFFDSADVIVFVCDGKVGVVAEDMEISKFLYKTAVPVLLVVNKIDAAVAKEQVHEFYQLGYKKIIPLSAQHGTGADDLLDSVVALIPTKKEIIEDKPSCKVVILGKPNVGKSSLLNLLLNEERAIVADIPGTTREPLTETIRFCKEDIEVTDTPGLRRQRGITEELEELMVQGALGAVQQADVVLLLVDASEGQFADQEFKLAFYAFDQLYKALIIVCNKQDLVTSESKERLDYHKEEYTFFLKKVALLDISCKSGKNIGKVIPLVNAVSQRYKQTLPGDLSFILKDAFQKKPHYKNKNLLHLYSATQVKAAPITIVLRVNVASWFGQSQLSYLEKVLREKFDLQGVPIRFLVRSKSETKKRPI